MFKSKDTCYWSLGDRKRAWDSVREAEGTVVRCLDLTGNYPRIFSKKVT